MQESKDDVTSVVTLVKIAEISPSVSIYDEGYVAWFCGASIDMALLSMWF